MAELSNLERSFDEIKNKTRVSTPNPWLDPKFNRIDPWGKEPGIRVDDIPERLGLIQQGQTLDLMGNDFIDLGDTPNDYGKNEQFVKTDGEGKLTFDWPYWVKAGSTIYYKKGNVGVGLSGPLVRFHSYGDNILDGAVTINESGRDKDFRVEGDTEINLLFCDASKDAIGIGTNSIEGSGCRLHVVGDDGKATSATYSAFAVVVIDNDGHCFFQITAPSTHKSGINFADDDSNPPAGSIYYNHANDEMKFGIGTNELVHFKLNHAVFTYGYIHLDSPDTYAVFVADSHNADSYVEYKEDGSTKWTAGFDYTDSFKYQISEGVPGTNVRFEIEPGASGLINCYQNIAVRNTKGILLYDNGNYVAFRAPALSADQIWVLPSVDASQAGSPLVSNASGTLSWAGDVDLGAGNFVTTGTLALGTGTAPTTSPADCFQMYSADIGGVAGKAGVHFRDEEGNIVSIGSGGVLMSGTARVYDGMELHAMNFKAPAAGAATQVNRGMGVGWEFSDGNEESVHTQIRIPGKWVDTEDLTAILIWDSPATSVNCDWEVRYLFRAADEDMTTAVAEGTVQAYKTSSGTANGLVHSTFIIPSAAFASGDKMLILDIHRDGNDGSDTLGDSAFLHAIMIRGIADRIGGSI